MSDSADKAKEVVHAVEHPVETARALEHEAEEGVSARTPLIVVTGIVASILLQYVPVEPVSPLPPTGTTGGLIISLLAGAVVAPFGEEILFRGFATTAWVRARGMRGGLILGALIFAFAHIVTVSAPTAGEAFQQAFVAFVGRIPIALALGVLFVRRGTIWASFGLHAAFNGILLVLSELLSRSI